MTGIDFTPPNQRIIEYTVGEPDRFFGPYSFELQPACGYELQLTFNYDESLFIHNESIQRFRLPSQTDNTNIGEYPVEITASVTWETDAANPSQTALLEETAKFLVRINPCPVSVITTSVTIDPITYTLGDPGFEIDPEIIFETDSVCALEFDRFELVNAPSNLSLAALGDKLFLD